MAGQHDPPPRASVHLIHNTDRSNVDELLPGLAEIPSEVDPARPSAARMYAHYLGSAHCFQSDRDAAERALSAAPWILPGVQQNRACLRRMVTGLVAQAGVNQFLDLGSGLPTAGNVHEVAQRLNPTCRVVYVDKDPIAVAHSRAILDGNPLAAVVQADIRDPNAVLGHAEVRRLLDFTAPVAVLMLSVLMWVDNPGELLPVYTAALAPGSFLAVTHATTSYAPEPLREAITAVEATYAAIGQPVLSRDADQLHQLLEHAGLQLVAPGVVFIKDWRPDLGEEHRPSDADTIGLAAMGRKP